MILSIARRLIYPGLKAKLAPYKVTRDEDMKERFYSRTKKATNPDDCVLWVGRLSPTGYGAFDWHGRGEGAHRVSWFLSKGEIPKGLCVLHRCDNRACVNPKHLFLGTQKENIKDMVSKGRQHHPRGSKNVKAKLTESDVVSIKKALTGKFGECRVLAKQYCVDPRTISAIATGSIWRHIQ